MKAAVADTSLALKWVVEEADSAEAHALRRHYRFIAPDFIYAECANVFWKLLRKGEFRTETIAIAVRAIQAEPLEIFPTRPLMAAALRMATRHDHPAYDCFFAALALREGCPMITADNAFARKMRDSEVRVLTIAEGLAEVEAPLS